MLASGKQSYHKRLLTTMTATCCAAARWICMHKQNVQAVQLNAWHRAHDSDLKWELQQRERCQEWHLRVFIAVRTCEVTQNSVQLMDTSAALAAVHSRMQPANIRAPQPAHSTRVDLMPIRTLLYTANIVKRPEVLTLLQ